MYNEMGSESTFYYPVRQTVVIRDDGISPAHLTVPVNTTIQWVNEGTRKHSVTWTGGRVTHFESGALKPGQSFEIRMAGDGPVTYSSGAYKGGIGVGLSASPKAVGGGHNGS